MDKCNTPTNTNRLVVERLDRKSLSGKRKVNNIDPDPEQASVMVLGMGSGSLQFYKKT
jgi:hypothetical protein